MTLSPEVLSGLRERLAAATGPDREIDIDLWGCLERKWTGLPQEVAAYEAPHYTASIDAALALVERMLPGFDYIIEHTNGGLTISCMLGTADPDKRAWGNTVPLAILLALLTALQENMK